MKCPSNTLQASWDAAAGAVSYISTLTGAGGFSASCPTANQSCLFPGLQCAHTYMLSVVALNNRCNSSESAKISMITGKCLVNLLFLGICKNIKSNCKSIHNTHLASCHLPAFVQHPVILQMWLLPSTACLVWQW